MAGDAPLVLSAMVRGGWLISAILLKSLSAAAVGDIAQGAHAMGILGHDLIDSRVVSGRDDQYWHVVVEHIALIAGLDQFDSVVVGIGLQLVGNFGTDDQHQRARIPAGDGPCASPRGRRR